MDYDVDVMDGPRADLADRQMATFYARHVKVLAEMTADDVAERFAMELSRASRDSVDPAEAEHRLATMHVRHGKDAWGAIESWFGANARRIVDGEIDSTSLAGLVLDREHLRPAWDRLARRLCGILEAGIPRLCQTDKPNNEPRLQEMCDGLLAAAGESLEREFPFVRWASRATKPDWSDAETRLWVELKYVRERKDILPITEAIAADITKYRANGQRCLFVTYDPYTLLVDRDSFVRDIEQHQGVMAYVLR